MSRGQRPRTHVFFPKMKRRSRKRLQGRATITLLDGNFEPIWPQVLTMPDGSKVAIRPADFRINHRRYDSDLNLWVDVDG